MIEALKQIADQPDDRDREQKKLTSAQLKLILMSLGEKMSEH